MVAAANEAMVAAAVVVAMSIEAPAAVAAANLAEAATGNRSLQGFFPSPAPEAS